MILDLFKRKADPQEELLREVLDQALVQRAKMDMEFPPGVTSLRDISGTLSNVGDTQLVLNVYGLKEASDRFLGQPVVCHFRIREGKAATGFYAFTVRVRRVAVGKNGALFFATDRPQKIERSQWRRSLRLRPAPERFEDLKIWPGDVLESGELRQPLVGLPELRQTKDCRLENLSAGGLGLHLSRAFCQARGFETGVGAVFTVYLHFAEEMRNQPRGLWLTAKVVRAYADPVTRDLELGLEFERVGAPVAEGAVRLAPVPDNVVREMSERLFEWHLQQNRSGGL